MAANPPLIVIIDDGLDPFWESLIRNKFSALGATIYELNSREEGLLQAQRIYQNHAGPKEVYFYGTRSSTSTEVVMGSTVHKDMGEMGMTMLMLSIGDNSVWVGGAALSPVSDMVRTDVTPGDDHLINTTWDEIFDGGDGLDVVSYNGPRNFHGVLNASSVKNYELVQEEAYPGGIYVSYLHGTDVLFNIERLQFSNLNVALDLKDGDSANTALRFLTAIVGKTALQNKALVGEAIAYTDAFETGDLAQLLIDAGVLAQFAGGSSDADLVKLLYANIAGQAPSAAELQWTLDFATGNGFTQADILEFAVGLSQNAPEALLLGQPGIDYLPYALF